MNILLIHVQYLLLFLMLGYGSRRRRRGSIHDNFVIEVLRVEFVWVYMLHFLVVVLSTWWVLG